MARFVHGRIKRIEIDESDHATFFFEGSSDSFSFPEFKKGSITRNSMQTIEYAIQDYNSEVELDART